MFGVKLSFIAFILIITWYDVHLWPSGAPDSVCDNLTPSHNGNQPQSTENPFKVSATVKDNKIKVTLSSPFSKSFRGFMIQARSARSRNRIIDGTFSTVPDRSKTIDCMNGKKNTLTHTNRNDKYEIVTEWTPKSKVTEDIIFRATVVKTFPDFWAETDSEPVKVEGIRGQTQSPIKRADDMYFDCFVNKGCYGYPRDCVNSENCDVLVSYMDSDDGVLFTMQSELPENNYMAVGLSDDEYMGNDSVTECFIDKNTVVVQHSWNERRYNTPLTVVPDGMYEWNIKNGIVSCSWVRPYVTDANGKFFDLKKNTYHMLVAKGPVYDGRVGRHDNRLASQEAVNFTAYESISSARSHDAIKIHGTFMVTGWVALVSFAILVARHFKDAWENKMLCGVKIWFAIHRGFMILALVFIVIAFIVIFVHKNGWNDQISNPHAILGCIATILGVLQPFMAAFRPSPDNSKRWIFNWLHFAVGNTAQIIAIITIFFAVSLEASGLKESFYWVMGVFVVVYYCIHLVFQLHSYSLEHKKGSDVKMQELGSGRNMNDHYQNDPSKPSPSQVFKTLFLGAFGIFLVVIMLALYSLIGIA